MASEPGATRTPSAKDPAYERRRPGAATIEIVAPAPFEWFEKWQGTTWGKRGDDYDAFKGLWLTGQDVLTCGVTGAMMAGLLTTSAIIGMRESAGLMKRVLNLQN